MAGPKRLDPPRNGDVIDQAIDDTEAQAFGPAMMQHQAIIRSTGRPAVLLLPEDATDAEVLEVVGWVAVHVRDTQRARAETKRGPQLAIARTLPT